MLYHPSTQNVIGVRPTLYDLINLVVITRFLVNDNQGHHVWMWLVCYPYLSVQISGKETNAPSSHCPSMRNTAEKNRKTCASLQDLIQFATSAGISNNGQQQAIVSRSCLHIKRWDCRSVSYSDRIHAKSRSQYSFTVTVSCASHLQLEDMSAGE